MVVLETSGVTANEKPGEKAAILLAAFWWLAHRISRPAVLRLGLT
jgi:hypothetical protein